MEHKVKSNVPGTSFYEAVSGTILYTGRVSPEEPQSLSLSASSRKGLYLYSSGQIMTETINEMAEELYIIELVIRPAASIRPGSPMSLPIVAVIKEASMKPDDLGPRRSGDMSGVWAFLSLLTADSSEVLVPPQTDLMRGRTAASVHAPTPQQEQDRSIIGYAHFPDLTITAGGQYRLRVSLIDMDSNGPAYREEGQAAVNMRSITSDIIHVTNNAATHRPCK